MSAPPEQRSWRASKRAAVRKGGRPGAQHDSGQARPASWWTQADIEYARDFLARQRAGGMLDAPTPPGAPKRVEDARERAYGAPPSPDGEGEEKNALHDSLTQDARPATPPPPPAPVERAVERPWIPAAVRAQMPVVDPMFTVTRVKEDGSVDPHHGYRWI